MRKKKSASERIRKSLGRDEAERRAAEAERQLAEFRATQNAGSVAAPAGKPALDQFKGL